MGGVGVASCRHEGTAMCGLRLLELSVQEIQGVPQLSTRKTSSSIIDLLCKVDYLTSAEFAAH